MFSIRENCRRGTGRKQGLYFAGRQSYWPSHRMSLGQGRENEEENRKFDGYCE